jgi:hypothetical protein
MLCGNGGRIKWCLVSPMPRLDEPLVFTEMKAQAVAGAVR